MDNRSDMGKRTENDKYETAQRSAFAFEHIMAYSTAVAAIALGVLGLLEGFGVVDIFSANAASVAGAPETGTVAASSFMDGLLFIIPAISFALLSFYFHSSDHHRLRDLRSVKDEDAAMWSAEHGGALVAGVSTMALAVIGLLVGFDAFGSGYTAEDGILWSATSLVPAVLSNTLHAVRHHQMETERDYLIAIVEERVGVATPRTAEAPRTAEPRADSITRQG